MSCSATLQLLDGLYAESVPATALVDWGPECIKGLTLTANHLHRYNFGGGGRGLHCGIPILANQDSMISC